MAVLCQIRDDGTMAEQWEISDRPLVVGRGQSVQVRVKDEAVSRRHFLIMRSGPDYVLEDLNSRNGTWLGGYRMSTAKLTDEDYILAGQTLFQFAERPLPPGEVKPRMGPHGTVMIPLELARA